MEKLEGGGRALEIRAFRGSDFDELKLDEERQLVREDVERHILNMSCRIASRSTSLSSNTEDDARNAFWIEAWQRFVGGLG